MQLDQKILKTDTEMLSTQLAQYTQNKTQKVAENIEEPRTRRLRCYRGYFQIETFEKIR